VNSEHSSGISWRCCKVPAQQATAIRWALYTPVVDHITLSAITTMSDSIVCSMDRQYEVDLSGPVPSCQCVDCLPCKHVVSHPGIWLEPPDWVLQELATIHTGQQQCECFVSWRHHPMYSWHQCQQHRLSVLMLSWTAHHLHQVQTLMLCVHVLHLLTLLAVNHPLYRNCQCCRHHGLELRAHCRAATTDPGANMQEPRCRVWMSASCSQ